MIHYADSTISYTGPAKFDRALEHVQSFPTGAAVLIGDGSQIKMLRSVVCGEFRLADPAEVQAAARKKVKRYDHAIVTHPALLSPE